jgi:hypothetical protein
MDDRDRILWLAVRRGLILIIRAIEARLRLSHAFFVDPPIRPNSD